MTIHPNDTCDGCEASLWDYKGRISHCPNCGARFCEECRKSIIETNVCPKCGRSPRDAT